MVLPLRRTHVLPPLLSPASLQLFSCELPAGKRCSTLGLSCSTPASDVPQVIRYHMFSRPRSQLGTRRPAMPGGCSEGEHPTALVHHSLSPPLRSNGLLFQIKSSGDDVKMNPSRSKILAAWYRTTSVVVGYTSVARRAGITSCPARTWCPPRMSLSSLLQNPSERTPFWRPVRTVDLTMRMRGWDIPSSGQTLDKDHARRHS